MYDRPYTGKVAEEVEAIVVPSVSFGFLQRYEGYLFLLNRFHESIKFSIPPGPKFLVEFTTS